MQALLEMGHGDEILICDGNYPKFGSPSIVFEWTDMGFAKYWI